ncbi:hypothetical protein C8J57DRAFT_1180102 [Mycena rebaudengoi]|nr:hypothetical protein C8J57DRAFT_1180102 [Mycena rebaudengoi]
MLNLLNLESAGSTHYMLIKEVCRLQTDIALFASRQFSVDDFERKWMELGEKRRKELALSAMTKLASIGPDIEPRRVWCPETTLQFLGGDGGRGFLDLLTKTIPDDLGQPIKEPIFIPNKALDALLRPVAAAPARRVLMDRAYYLSLVLWRVLLDFYELDEEYVLNKSARTPRGELKALRSIVEDKKWYAEVSQERDAGRSKKVNTCWGCGISELALGAEKKLLECSGCRPMPGRRVRYCSRECQRDDWKNGIPVPHKTICGKPFVDTGSATAAPKSAGGPVVVPEGLIPKSNPSFKRRPALLLQLMHLQRHPFPDYVFFTPDNAIVIFFSHNRLDFLVLRKRALTSGDHIAVNMMFPMLCSYTQGAQGYISAAQVKQQLENEYGVTIAAGPAPAKLSIHGSQQERDEVSRALNLLVSDDNHGTDDRIPIADASFQRNPALLHQISLLTSPPLWIMS